LSSFHQFIILFTGDEAIMIWL